MENSAPATRRVVIGGREHDKPWYPDCAACRSPWMLNIDSMLAEGYSLRLIRKHLANRHPAVPSEPVLRAHIPHLAEPHRKSRMAFEEAAAARGEDTASSSASLSDALDELVRQGHEALVHGELDLQPRDLTRAIQLKIQLDKSRASEGVEASAWQTAFMEFFEIARRVLSPQQWGVFVDEVYASPAIQAVMAGEQPALASGGAPE